MSGMSYMEKLLDGIEVEWKALGDFAAINTGQKPSVILDSATDFDYINAGTSRSGYSAGSNCEGDTVTTPSRGQGGIGYVGYQKNPFWLGPLCYKIKSLDNTVLINKYIFYFFQSKSELLLGLKKEGGVPAVNKSDLAKLEIPIPCPENPKKSLEIQSEIACILDTFTELTAELTAELTSRKKQYSYYRDQLLSFEDGQAEWKTLGELAEYSKMRISYTELNGSNYVGVESLLQNRAGKTDSIRTPESGYLTKYSANDILIGNIRPYLKKIWYADRTGGTNGDVLVIHPTDSTLNSRYLYQVLADDKFFEYNMQHAKGAKMPRGNKLKIMEYLVPIPFASDAEKSLAEQARIVAILDIFDALTSSITEGLPREISLRQQQYAYCRDLLLSFAKPEEVAA